MTSWCSGRCVRACEFKVGAPLPVFVPVRTLGISIGRLFFCSLLFFLYWLEVQPALGVTRRARV